MKTRSEVFQFEKELKWEHPAPGNPSSDNGIRRTVDDGQGRI